MMYNAELMAKLLLDKRIHDEKGQQRSAREIGISQPQFFKMESGFNNPSFENVAKCARWLGVSVELFVNY